VARTATADEAAAIAAAIARFEAETGAAPAPPQVTANPWQRAALLEGVGAKEPVEDSQGGPKWLS
jgi:hypothetical protein